MFVKSLAISTKINVKNTGIFIRREAICSLIFDSIEKMSVRGTMRDDRGIARIFIIGPIIDMRLKWYAIIGSVPSVANIDERVKLYSQRCLRKNILTGFSMRGLSSFLI